MVSESPADWHIRLMRAEDIIPIVAIEGEVFGDPWAKDVFESELANPSAVYLCALGRGGEIWGYIGSWIVAGELHITNIAVRKSEQHRGVGKHLLQLLENRARTEGCSVAYLEVRRGNLSAQKFYQKRGYTVVHVRPNYYVNPTEDALVLKKTLSGVEDGHHPGG